MTSTRLVILSCFETLKATLRLHESLKWNIQQKNVHQHLKKLFFWNETYLLLYTIIMHLKLIIFYDWMEIQRRIFSLSNKIEIQVLTLFLWNYSFFAFLFHWSPSWDYQTLHSLLILFRFCPDSLKSGLKSNRITLEDSNSHQPSAVIWSGIPSRVPAKDSNNIVNVYLLEKNNQVQIFIWVKKWGIFLRECQMGSSVYPKM